jgi:hypothetical protein
MTEEMEDLGQAIDRVDSLAHGLNFPIHDSMHVAQLKVILPEVVAELKAAFVKVTKQNPWGATRED